MKMILGKKIGMISSFTESGEMIPITIVHSEPNFVIETKTLEKDGYLATKVGFLNCNEKNINKSQLGIFKKANCSPKKHIKEFRNISGYKIGDTIKVDSFNIGDHVDIQAFTKGHGFTGAIKRWNFKCGPKSHGAGFPHRYQGSISFGRGGSQAQRVMKGKKMSGHYGVEKVTIHNLTIFDIDIEKNIFLIKGSMPGPKNSLVLIKTTNRNKNFKNINNLVKNNKTELNDIQANT